MHRHLVALATAGGAIAAQQQQPNIVFVLADDLGSNELNFMNNTRGILTPHLDASTPEALGRGLL